MPDLVLDSLEIRNFRGLQELRIERLGRVNLIVGKNNVGKTSVLEALRLYASGGSLEVLLDLVESRDQFDPNSSLWKGQVRRSVLPFSRLFFTQGRNALPPGTTIKIGEADLPEGSLSVDIDSNKTYGYDIIFKKFSRKTFIPMYLPIGPGGPPIRESVNSADLEASSRKFPSSHVGAGGLSTFQIEQLWNEISLTSLEDDVLQAMRLIASGVDRMDLKPIDVESNTRVPFVKLKGVDLPVPLRSLGDGMNRIFGIALALVSAKDGLLLIDEVENGLHYSVQPDIWRLIFQSASRLNVQVFATTHSLDCIKAFEVAARESAEEGVLIRLAQKAGRILVGEFDESDLGVAVEGQIEVR